MAGRAQNKLRDLFLIKQTNEVCHEKSDLKAFVIGVAAPILLLV